jgi:hypothetical protein
MEMEKWKKFSLGIQDRVLEIYLDTGGMKLQGLEEMAQ